jgi:transcriptional regulator with GAF, ATPase, and Fis domain
MAKHGGKDSRGSFHVRLYVIVPVIFGGIASLSSLVAFRVVEHCGKLGIEPLTAVTAWTLTSTIIGFAVGFIVVRVIWGPVLRFIEEAERLVVVKEASKAGKYADGRRRDEISRFNQVFDQVSEVLSMVEAGKRFPGIVGESRAIRSVLSQIAKVAPTDSSVLLLGESGTGKELVAQALYDNSARGNKPFVKINCAAIPEGLLESELFGHEKGAFTGAAARKKGKFEIANGGTVFLDEIGDMSPGTQAKILRVLQERQFERVGGNETLRCDVRILAATNKDLDEMVEKGAFREDLLYRIKVFTLFLPPLRDRRGDIPLLADHFLSNRRQAGEKVSFSSEAMHLMMAHSWPGNIRELQNAVERVAVMAEGPRIEPRHLPPEISLFQENIFSAKPHGTAGMDDRLGELEKAMIVEALKRSQGVQVKAASILGINQRSLWHRVKKYGIDVNEFKP